MPKNTSTRSNGARARRAGGEAPVEHAQREAQRVRRAAQADAARIRSEAEDHARRLVIDARASADGVRAEGMELVSHLREMGDVLRSNADRLLHDIQAIHSRMVGELERAAPGEAAQPPAGGPAATDDEVLDLPDFVSRG